MRCQYLISMKNEKKKKIIESCLVQIFLGILRVKFWVNFQGPVVQSIVSLVSSLVVKMLTVLVSTISNSQLFLLKKCE